jgi:hypothetical protein
MLAVTSERLEAQRLIPASAEAIFAVLCDPQGHVAIDSSGMLMDAEGEPVTAAGDRFLVHMDREALGDVPLGHYDVQVVIEAFEPDKRISWTVDGQIKPPIGHVYGYELVPAEGGTLVTSFYDWSAISDKWRKSGLFPVISQPALRATLGILERAVVRGYPRAAQPQ